MTWGHSALHYAALYGHKEMVIMLLKRGADARLETAGSKKNALQVAKFRYFQALGRPSITTSSPYGPPPPLL